MKIQKEEKENMEVYPLVLCGQYGEREMFDEVKNLVVQISGTFLLSGYSLSTSSIPVSVDAISKEITCFLVGFLMNIFVLIFGVLPIFQLVLMLSVKKHAFL